MAQICWQVHEALIEADINEMDGDDQQLVAAEVMILRFMCRFVELSGKRRE